MTDSDATVYRVVRDANSFLVQDDSEQTVCTCNDRRTAEHYAVLLNQAYRRGYRQGKRAQRRGTSD